MRHLNGNLLCSIDIETTGLKPGTHDIIEIAVVPLNNDLKVHKGYLAFHQKVRPRFVENVDPRAMEINKMDLYDCIKHGIDYYDLSRLLEKWFDYLNIGYNKKVVPLGHNYGAFDRNFIIEAIGELTYTHIFDHRYRDLMQAALTMNDRAHFFGEVYPFPKVHLQYLCSQMNVNREKPHSAVADALATAECYKRLIATGLGPLDVSGLKQVDEAFSDATPVRTYLG